MGACVEAAGGIQFRRLYKPVMQITCEVSGLHCHPLVRMSSIPSLSVPLSPLGLSSVHTLSPLSMQITCEVSGPPYRPFVPVPSIHAYIPTPPLLPCC